MTERIFKNVADFMKYRVSMKRALRKIGCHIDNDTDTDTLEEMMRINNLEGV